MTRHDDLETLERELAASLGTPLQELRARRAHCPPLDLLRASAGDALLPDQRIAIEEHLRGCPLCRALAADLQDDELTTSTADEVRRISARFDAGRRTRPAVLRAWLSVWPSALALRIWRPAVGVLALAVVVWIARAPRPDAPPETPAASEPRASPSIPAALRLEMPEVRLRASAVLATRGGADAQQYLEDLGPALAAYEAGDYGAAARRFSALEPKYRDAVEVFFYGGVSSLHEGANAPAVGALERARALDEPEFADDIHWYLGLAYHRAGNLEAARAEFAKLCAGTSSFSTRACEAGKASGGAR